MVEVPAGRVRLEVVDHDPARPAHDPPVSLELAVETHGLVYTPAMGRKVEIDQEELDALRAVANAAKHLMSMSAGVRTGEPKLFSELRERTSARHRLAEALEEYARVSG